MIVKVHSIIDVITNSSTEIFSWANGTDQLYELFDAILKAGGSNIPAKDIFDIKILPTDFDCLIDLFVVSKEWEKWDKFILS